MWQPNERYPDPSVRVLDPAFNKYRLALASVERLYTGCRWAEGPVWFGDGRYLLWSDIPNNRILRWDEEIGRRQRSSASRPTTPTATRATARAGWSPASTTRAASTRTEYDGAITVLADRYNGKRLNSPNDVVVKSDGSIWFTDPPFGILGYYEGHKAESENSRAVYRLDADDRQAARWWPTTSPAPTASPSRPTRRSSTSSDRAPSRIARSVSYDVTGDGTTLGKGRVLIDAGPGGSPDGFRVDVDGNLWCGWGMGSRRARRRARVRRRGQADRPYRAAGALRQRLLRRPLAQPAVHGGEPFALCALRQHAGRGRRLIAQSTAMRGIDSNYAWWRLAASVGLSTVGGIGMWSLMVAIPAVQTDFGISRADISFAYTMNTLGFFAGGVIVGRLVDRRGIVVAAILSAIGLALGFALAPLTSSLILFSAAQVLIGFSAAATFAPLVADISHWFEKRRGVAVAIAASGNYFAGTIWPPIIERIIHDHGWRTMFWSAAAFCLVAMIPLALTLKRRPPDHEETELSPRWRAGHRRPSACRPTPCRG